MNYFHRKALLALLEQRESLEQSQINHESPSLSHTSELVSPGSTINTPQGAPHSQQYQ
jgi:hypothetical protein